MVKAGIAPERFVKPDQLRGELAAAATHSDTTKASLRPNIVKVLKAALEQSHALAERQLLADGDGTRCAESLRIAFAITFVSGVGTCRMWRMRRSRQLSS